MEGEVLDHCGIVVAHTLHDAYNMIKSLQNRGREATGIAAIGEGSIDVIKWIGPVNTFDLDDLHNIFPPQKYHTYFAHVRYATHGRKDKILEDAHPHTIGGIEKNNKDHILIRDCEMVAIHNGQVNEEYFNNLDDIEFKTGCDTEKLLHYYKRFGIKKLVENIPGSFSLAVADKNNIYVCRDKFGMKPCVLGKKDGKHIFASESLAIDENGGITLQELNKGQIYALSKEGLMSTESYKDVKKSAHCFFEYNYLANPESTINNVNVKSVRELLGIALAKEHKIFADYVTYLPRCPKIAAYSYAKELNIPFLEVFYKKTKERAFQGSNAEDRNKSIRSNLNLVPNIEDTISGKSIIIIDDSVIRGNNCSYVKELLNSVKVKDITLMSYTPRIGILGDDGKKRGCLFGVDMPIDDNFISFDKEKNVNRSYEDISKMLGINVKYLSVRGMLDVYNKIGLKDKICYFCIGGGHPFD